MHRYSALIETSTTFALGALARGHDDALTRLHADARTSRR